MHLHDGSNYGHRFFRIIDRDHEGFEQFLPFLQEEVQTEFAHSRRLVNVLQNSVVVFGRGHIVQFLLFDGIQNVAQFSLHTTIGHRQEILDFIHDVDDAPLFHADNVCRRDAVSKIVFLTARDQREELIQRSSGNFDVFQLKKPKIVFN